MHKAVELCVFVRLRIWYNTTSKTGGRSIMKLAPADKDVSYSHLHSDMTFVQTGRNFTVFTEILSFFWVPQVDGLISNP